MSTLEQREESPGVPKVFRGRQGRLARRACPAAGRLFGATATAAGAVAGPWTPAEARVWVRATGQAGSFAARRCRTRRSRRTGRMFEEVLVPDRAGLSCGRLMAVWT